MIITMLPISTQRLTELEIVVAIFSTFFNRFGLKIFPLLHALHYNAKIMRWILLKFSEDDYEYATYLLQMFC